MSDLAFDHLPAAVVASSGQLVKPKDAAMTSVELLSAAAPFRNASSDEVDVLANALCDIGRAARDHILTPAESEALLREVVRQFAGRQLTRAIASAWPLARS